VSTAVESPTNEPSFYARKGIASWLLTTDHKRIALLYLEHGAEQLPLLPIDETFRERSAYREGSLTDPTHNVQTTVVPAASLAPLPEGWDETEMAAAPLTFLTAWQALTQWSDPPKPPEPGSTLLVTGASGDGIGFATALRLARAGGRIALAVGGHHAEEVLAVGQHVGVESHRILVRVAAEQLPLGLAFAAEVSAINQAVAIGIFGLPGDRDLLRGGARQRLRGRAGRGRDHQGHEHQIQRLQH